MKEHSSHLLSKAPFRIAASVALILHFGAAMLGLLPYSCEIRKRFYEPIREYRNYLNLGQDWDMFVSPLPNVNCHLACLFTFEDGTKMIWQPPRVDKRDLKDRNKVEKWRKFALEQSLCVDNRDYWPDLARWFGRKFYIAADKPYSMSYQRWWAKIPPPCEPCAPRERLPKHTDVNTVFVYKYGAGDF